ncbi:MAG: quinolinate synthase NadA [Fimbriimonadaceae bacterium]|nr:quinolinate synthase NadA [Fimbriimonadaceae bacterium]
MKTRQAPLPESYVGLPEVEIDARIIEAKEKLGSRLVILGHHYQRDSIIRHADFRGDSYKLAKDAGSLPDAEYIVFCGVHFMAESADILTPPSQVVILPNMAAGCSMADMANIFQVRNCWRALEGLMDVSKVVPVTYINSAANLKAFVGEQGGTVCTSTNAPAAVEWALQLGEKVLFFPDQHLGRNTGVRLGYDPSDMVVWDPFRPLGGNSAEALERAKFILWKGHCSVHSRFNVGQIEKARAEFPGVNVIVHPECSLEVVQASDDNGSTSHIIKMVSEAPPGTTWAVGTEINLVQRLANEHPSKTIFCLDPQICPCSTMYRIHPSFLLYALEELVEGRVVNQVSVPDEVATFARKSLDQMLQLP